MAKKNNVYHVKLKLIPKEIGYKSSFTQGIVLDTTQTIAGHRAVREFEDYFKKQETIPCTIELHSIKKLRSDFILCPLPKDEIKLK